MQRVRATLTICVALLAAASRAASEATVLGYLGGSGTDDCDGIAMDWAGAVYLACHSDSSDFPPVAGGQASGRPGNMDAVIVKLEARTGRVAWITRTGGSTWDGAGDVEVASDGSVYVLGSTRSTDFPTTPDAVQRRFGGQDRDVFLLKLDHAGKIVYSTLLGGSKNDEASGLAVGSDGTVFIGGVTTSSDFPGIRAKLGPTGRPDGFVVRFTPGLPNSLQTVLIGGTGIDHISGLTIDRFGNLFAAGFTASADFPVKNASQNRFGGSIDGFLLKLRVSTWEMVFSTWLGGSKMDGAYSVALDSSGNPIVSGVTESGNFPSTPSAFQPGRRGPVDAFVTKLSVDGGRILWSTFYGGSRPNSDQFLGGKVAVDSSDRVWLTGMTSSLDLPTLNAAQPVYGGGNFDGFVVAFSTSGSKLCYGSYLGGIQHDVLEGLAVGNGRVYVSGLTSSANLPQKNSQIQPGYGGGPLDAIIIGLDLPDSRSCR